MTARTCGPGSLREWERVFWVVEVGAAGSEDDGSDSDDAELSSRGNPVVLLGVCREAVIRTAVIVGLLLGLLLSLSSGASRSLLTQRVQANVSPTYAAPKLAGRVRRGVRGEEVDDGSVDG